jgi:transcriptional regulator with XRE-family HTH domain
MRHSVGPNVAHMGRSNISARHRELGAELRKRRLAAGVTVRHVSEDTGWNRAKVARVESGKYPTNPVEAVLYLGACGVYRAQALDLLQLSREAENGSRYWLSPHGEWLEDTLSALIYHESTAVRSTSYEPFVIPGLLQTAAYARAQISQGPQPPAEIEALVRVRVERQQLLRRPRPARFIFFLQEQALRLRFGSDAIMHEQLLHLVLMAALDHVTLRVVPASTDERTTFGSAFRLLEYRRHDPLVYLDNICSGLFIEDRDYVADYRRLLPELEAASLDEGQSRMFAADLADAFDRGSARDAGIYELEEEHR